MKYISIHVPGGQIRISKIILGTDHFGTNISKEMAYALMDTYFNMNGNTLDTARIYGKKEKKDSSYSLTEPIVGAWINERVGRERIVLISKGGYPDMEDMSVSRLTSEHIENDINMSLSELGTNYIDLYFLHRDDPTLRVNEIIDILDRHVKIGKIRGYGASNWRADRIEEANNYAIKKGKLPFIASQINWSAAVANHVWDDDPTIVYMDCTELEKYKKLRIPVFAFSSQAKGYFSKKIINEPILRERAKKFDIPANRKRAQLISKISKRMCVPVSAIVISYITTSLHDFDSCAIISCSNTIQLIECMSYSDLNLDYKDWRKISTIF